MLKKKVEQILASVLVTFYLFASEATNNATRTRASRVVIGQYLNVSCH